MKKFPQEIVSTTSYLRREPEMVGAMAHNVKDKTPRFLPMRVTPRSFAGAYLRMIYRRDLEVLYFSSEPAAAHPDYAAGLVEIIRNLDPGEYVVHVWFDGPIVRGIVWSQRELPTLVGEVRERLGVELWLSPGCEWVIRAQHQLDRPTYNSFQTPHVTYTDHGHRTSPRILKPKR